MTSLRTVARWVFPVALPLAMTLAASPPAAALDAAAPRASSRTGCVPVYLTAVGQDLGPDSQGWLHTEADVYAGRIRVADTTATFTPSIPVGASLGFAGPIVFTPTIGRSTLTATVDGAVDLATGAFTATSTAITGTGALARVSGSLTFRGVENLGTGAFTETITGTLCGRTHR